MVKFEYEATGKTPEDEVVSDSGQCEISLDMDDFPDDGILYSEAFSSVMDSFYSFGFEKKGHTEVSEVTITIKNLEIKY